MPPFDPSNETTHTTCAHRKRIVVRLVATVSTAKSQTNEVSATPAFKRMLRNEGPVGRLQDQMLRYRQLPDRI